MNFEPGSHEYISSIVFDDHIIATRYNGMRTDNFKKFGINDAYKGYEAFLQKYKTSFGVPQNVNFADFRP